MIRAPHLRCTTPTRGVSRFILGAFAVALIAVNLAAFRHAIGWEVFYNTDTEVMLDAAQAAGWRQALGWVGGPWIGAPLCLYYRPTSSWLMWGEWALFGWRASGYQWVSMALHLAAALLFWRIAARLLGGPSALRLRSGQAGSGSPLPGSQGPPRAESRGGEMLAAGAALIFSLRPRNVRTLAVLTAQPDLVAAAFMFLSLLALLVLLSRSRPRFLLLCEAALRCEARVAIAQNDVSEGAQNDKSPASRQSAHMLPGAALLAASLVAALLALGGKEMALSLPLLASLVILFDDEVPRRRKAWLLAAYWGTFAAFMVGRSFAMSGLGYIPKGWRDPLHAVSAFGRSAGLYFAYPFASAVLTREWWPGAMFAVIGVYAAAARRWPALRGERVLLYVAAPAFIGASLGFGALFYENWTGVLTPYPWQLLGSMLLYAMGAGLVIARDRRAALFVLLWGLFALVPAAYRVYDWPGKFFYIPHTFWAFAVVLLVEALVALALKRAGQPGLSTPSGA